VNPGRRPNRYRRPYGSFNAHGLLSAGCCIEPASRRLWPAPPARLCGAAVGAAIALPGLLLGGPGRAPYPARGQTGTQRPLRTTRSAVPPATSFCSGRLRRRRPARHGGRHREGGLCARAVHLGRRRCMRRHGPGGGAARRRKAIRTSFEWMTPQRAPACPSPLGAVTEGGMACSAAP